MTLYIQIIDNEVREIWDTPPEEGVGNNGWRNAVEVKTDIIPHRQGYRPYRLDVSVDPVQIIWDAYAISVDDRKTSMKAKERFKFRNVVEEQTSLQLSANPDEQYSATAVEAARQTMVAKQAAIDAATTHDELDALL